MHLTTFTCEMICINAIFAVEKCLSVCLSVYIRPLVSPFVGQAKTQYYVETYR